MPTSQPYTVQPFRHNLADIQHYIVAFFPYLRYSFASHPDFLPSQHIRWSLHECYLDCGEWHESN